MRISWFAKTHYSTTHNDLAPVKKKDLNIFQAGLKLLKEFKCNIFFIIPKSLYTLYMRVQCATELSIVHTRVALHISDNSRVYSATMVDSDFSEAGGNPVHLKAH